MTENFFKGIFDTALTTTISISDFLLCIAFSLILGVLLSLSYMFRTRYSKSFLLTLLLLPAVVCVVIMMVNGNVGTGVAVAGAFSLVRFRSVPGSAKEICTLFLAMGAGLIAGMGYLGFSLVFTLIMCAVLLLSSLIGLPSKSDSSYKTLRIMIPEDLDYSGVFDPVFQKYCTSVQSVQVKTANMGSMYKLTYDIVLKDIKKEKEFIDELRTRNGNLEISVSKQSTELTQL